MPLLHLPLPDPRGPGPRLLSPPPRCRAVPSCTLATALCLLAWGSALAREMTLRFTSPPPGIPVAGETKVLLEAVAAEGARVVRVEVFIDSQRVAVLERAPFEFLWNAGEAFQPHRLLARATDDSGGSVTATLETPPLRVGQRESVTLVSLYLNVFDSRGKALTDLTRESFLVWEDGKGQIISQFTAARQPLSVALVLDASNSMGTGERMETARRAALDFVKSMDPSDRAMVVSFSDTVVELQPLTGDRKKLERSIQKIVPAGGTALYDALVRVAGQMKDLTGRKAVVLLSDGRDQAFKENAPGSLHLFEEAVDAVARSEIVLYAIGLGARLEDETDLAQRRSLRKTLETFSEKTGGRFYNPERAGQLSDVYRQITEDLGRQYSLSYSPSNQSRDGRWRVVRVEVDRPGARVLTRPGYFAPSP